MINDKEKRPNTEQMSPNNGDKSKSDSEKDDDEECISERLTRARGL